MMSGDLFRGIYAFRQASAQSSLSGTCHSPRPIEYLKSCAGLALALLALGRPCPQEGSFSTPGLAASCSAGRHQEVPCLGCCLVSLVAPLSVLPLGVGFRADLAASRSEAELLCVQLWDSSFAEDQIWGFSIRGGSRDAGFWGSHCCCELSTVLLLRIGGHVYF